MKKALSMILTGILLLNLTACGAGVSKTMAKEGVERCALSNEEKDLLSAFGMLENSQVISFKAPKEAISLYVHIYRLNADGGWEEYSGGGASLGEDRALMNTLSGVFTMELTENYGIEFHIDCGGLASYKSKEIQLDKEILGSSREFLREFQPIEVNTEIPVALMVHTAAATMKSHCLEDFFAPSQFEGMDLVQAVTLEFSDQ